MDYQSLLNELEYGTQHLIIDGPAGSGKTHLILNFLAQTERKVIVMAPTGLAASHIDGATIHSVFKFPPALTIPDEVEIFGWAQPVVENADMILIDEISMVGCNLLDGIDRELQAIKKNNAPFGGMRVVLVGDHFQLGPVVKEVDRPFLERLSSNYRAPFYYFQAEVVWRKAFRNNLAIFLLMGNYRHKEDVEFKASLDRMRFGSPNDEDLLRVNLRALQINEAHGPMLCMTNEAVNYFNMLRVAELPGNKLWTVLPEPAELMYSSDLAVKDHPALEPVIIQEGARVMVTKNDRDGRYRNGSVGTVVEIRAASMEIVSSVVVDLDEGGEVELARERFDVMRPWYNDAKDRIEIKKVATIRNIPLRLAYGFTIHKAQGLTLEAAILNRENGAFAPGQMYTSVSRVKSLEGLYLTQPLKKKDFECHPKIKEFFKTFKDKIRSASESVNQS